MELTPIQKLREDIKDLDILLYIRVLTLLVEAEEQERLFLEKIYKEYDFEDFDTFYKQFGKAE
jgi:hypothetical protein